MKNLKFTVLVAVLSAAGFAFSLSLQQTKAVAAAGEYSKCRILSLKEAFQSSKAVFVGKVVSDEKTGDLRTFEFEVEKYWKGAASKTIKIDVYETWRFQARFKTGESYLIYAAAAAEKGNLRVGRCSRSRSIEDAAEDLKQLGKGKNPQ